VPELLLDKPEVLCVGQKVGCKGMPAGVDRVVIRQPHVFGSLLKLLFEGHLSAILIFLTKCPMTCYYTHGILEVFAFTRGHKDF